MTLKVIQAGTTAVTTARGMTDGLDPCDGHGAVLSQQPPLWLFPTDSAVSSRFRRSAAPAQSIERRQCPLLAGSSPLPRGTCKERRRDHLSFVPRNLRNAPA